MDENRLYYVGIKALIEREGKLLILKEAPDPDDNFPGGEWELPGGRIQHTEDSVPLVDILLREVREECGGIQIDVRGPLYAFRRHFSNGKWVFLLAFHCLYKDGDLVLSAEHNEFAWITKSDIQKYTFVNGYKEAIQHFFQLQP